jgi:hypothetical protein
VKGYGRGPYFGEKNPIRFDEPREPKKRVTVDEIMEMDAEELAATFERLPSNDGSK